MPRKKINIITPHFAPENTAASHRMESVARTLSASFEVNVFTLTEKGKKPRANVEQWNDDLKVHYLYLPNYPKNIFLIRAFFEWWYSKKLVRFSNSVNSDLVMFTSPFMFLLNSVANLSNCKNKVADIRDLVWHYLPAKNFVQRKLKSVVTRHVHSSFEKFIAITVTNHSEKDWLIKNANVNPEKIEVIPNGLSEDKFRFLQTIRYSKPQKDFVISYIGNIGSAQVFIPLIEAIRNKEGVKLNLIGDGNERENIQRYLLEEDVRNVFVPGKLRWARIIPYYQSSSILYSGLKEEFNTAVPSKIYEYLSTGLPILFLGQGATKSLLENFDNIYAIDDYSEEALKKAIAKIRYEKPANSLPNTLAIGENFIREKISLNFVELLAGILNEKVPGEIFVEDLLKQ
ncbi:MAG TPA: glycosyltransferase family 4 protein [Bacteroidia bacterium]|nr:glycosyltransferase family 4 protein [Bacteroidota bacterium]HQV99500.1 glycosyltransferase family 4 protein [Bacteroidia bacterium]HQW22153.1 glycosyltransferase family 4 protein [Bacteroidia bacterium]